MWEAITNIASICSIIALPIALWQIYDLKSKVEATEKGVKTVLDIKEHEKLSQIFKVVVEQYQKIGNWVSQLNKTGKSRQTIIKECQEIIRSINLCIIDIPPQYADVFESFKSAIEYLEKYLESDMSSNSELKESRDYLNNAIQSLKREQKEYESRTIMMVSHNNE